MSDEKLSRRAWFHQRESEPEELSDEKHPDAEGSEGVIPKEVLRKFSAQAEAESGESFAGDIEAEFVDILEGDDEAEEQSVPLSGFETDIISNEMLEAQAQAEAEEAEQERIAKIVAEHDARLAEEEQASPGNDKEDERQSE